MSKDVSIGWMYEGAKGNVHREDYLLGKKVDKNFEKYSDVVNAQKAEAIDSIVGTRAVFNSGQSTGLKTSSLQKDIIKSEDPFVAVKVREETKRREIMDNPLTKMRLQAALKSMMTSKAEKSKEKKSKKDKKKKKKKRSSSSSDESSDERVERKRRRSPSPKRRRRPSEKPRKRSRSPRRERPRSPKRSREESRKLSRKPSSSRSKSPRRSREDPRKVARKPSRSRSRSAERLRRKSRSPRRSREEPRKMSRSRSRSADKASSSRQFDSHIPRHLQQQRSRHDSSSGSESEHETRSSHRRRNSDDDERQDPRKKSYGLVEMRKRTAEEREEESRAPTKEYKLVKIPTGRGTGNTPREPRRALSEAEKAARLAEMQQDNVKWRDEIRERNVTKGRKEDDEEKEEADKNGYAPSFIRSQMREACDDMTVEKRLQSNKRGVQRAHGYMDRSFAKK